MTSQQRKGNCVSVFSLSNSLYPFMNEAGVAYELQFVSYFYKSITFHHNARLRLNQKLTNQVTGNSFSNEPN